ncbi:hypothetical protein L6452_06382 [Arctium lappa]|uniref:Uncharacterized protein n=1 Tax=Arctium lappa TaxID=4217 RepID=A0ACB9EJG4_ARCLA|nr:hypothetical protein L6452_06382 [Arctium lappa]
MKSKKEDETNCDEISFGETGCDEEKKGYSNLEKKKNNMISYLLNKFCQNPSSGNCQNLRKTSITGLQQDPLFKETVEGRAKPTKREEGF